MADQGAGSNSGQSAGGNRFVKFSHGAAQRIAKAVRIVEGGDRGQPGITFEHPIPSQGGKAFRVATFTSAWATGTSATLTFYNVTSTPNTVVATNLHFGVKGSGTIECMIAKDGTAWYLASVNLTKLQSYAAGEIQLLGHDDEGYGRWYSVNTCSTSTAS